MLGTELHFKLTFPRTCRRSWG